MATRADVRRLIGSRAPNSRMALSASASRGLGAGLTSRRPWTYLLGETWPSGTPLPATECEALGFPPFGRGLALLANAVAATDWHAQRFDPDLGVSVKLADQPSIVTDPDPTATTWQYRWAATEDGVLFGNHFAIFGDLDFRTMRPGWLVPVAADQVWLMTDPDGLYWWTIGGEMFTPDEILHVSYGNRSGELLGRGVLAQYAESLGGMVAAERHSGSYFAAGALPPAILQSPTVVGQDQADELKEKWREMTSTREPVVLPLGYVLTPVVSNAEQSQLVESRTWNAELAAMILGIPPWKLGLEGPTMTYQNVETADIDFIRDSADRYARPLAASFSKWLMPRGTDVVFDYADRMRADQRTTADVLKIYVDADILTDDEARAVIGRPPKATVNDDNSTPQGVPELTPTDTTS
jgi:phage portal protein BeeE